MFIKTLDVFDANFSDSANKTDRIIFPTEKNEKNAFLTLNPFKRCAIYYNDIRYVAVRYDRVRYGALENLDKYGLPTVINFNSENFCYSRAVVQLFGLTSIIKSIWVL